LEREKRGLVLIEKDRHRSSYPVNAAGKKSKETMGEGKRSTRNRKKKRRRSPEAELGKNEVRKAVVSPPAAAQRGPPNGTVSRQGKKKKGADAKKKHAS